VQLPFATQLEDSLEILLAPALMTPDTLAMLKSSAHPRAAGVADEIERVLATR
jgi:hypothetical protein